MQQHLQLITAICCFIITTATCSAQSTTLKPDTEQYYIKRPYSERQNPLRSDSLVLRQEINQQIQSREIWRVIAKCDGLLIGTSAIAYIFVHSFHFNIAKSISLTMPLSLVFWYTLPDLPSYNRGFKHTHGNVYTQY